MAATAPKLETKPAISPGIFDRSQNLRFVIGLLLSLTTLLVFSPAARNGFVSFDDPAYVTGNRHVRSGLTLETLIWAFRSTEYANWHPVTWLSHALDCQLFGINPAGHHYMTLLLHAANVALLFLFLEWTTGMMWRSAAAAALFALHPINVQSVAWASERKNVLCTLFFILALLAYNWYTRRPTVGRYLGVAACFALGLMSKPMVVTLPFVLLLLDYWPLGRLEFSCGLETSKGVSPASGQGLPNKPRSLFWMVKEKLPFFALAAASSVITMVVQRAGGATRGEYSLGARVANATVSYSLYLWKAIWPSKFAILYPFPDNGLPAWKVLLSALVILAITVLVLLVGSKKYLIVGWFWFLGTLVPVIGLVQVGEQAMADRYAYIPFVGLFVALAWGIGDWAGSKPLAKRYIVYAAVLVLVAFGFVTRGQIGYWQNSVILWSHAIEVTNANYVAENSLGVELLKAGEVQKAAKRFQNAAAINPRDAFSELNLGVCQKHLGDLKSATEHYEAALRLSTEPSLRSTAYSNLGSVYRNLRDYSRARENYEAAIKLSPENQYALTGLALIEQKTGNLDAAVSYYAKAAAAAPSDVAYDLLARALAQAGRDSEARTAFEEAQRMTTNPQLLQQTVNRLLSE